MIVSTTLSKNENPTPAQLHNIENAMSIPVEYDEDCPPITPGMVGTKYIRVPKYEERHIKEN